MNVGSVLGRVAKGVIFGDARAALTATPSDESEVEMLLHRISEAHQPEYRREAMQQLKDLLTDNPRAQQALGNMGLPILVSVLQDDREDEELLRGALEVLVAAMAGEPLSAAQQAAVAAGGVLPHPEDQAGAINAEIFSRRRDNITLLLTFLEDEPVGVNDFYVRYYTVQLLTALLTHCSFKLQESILASPMGVVRLMDMLMEREVIRNETLLLLVALTRSNGEVQKIAAFEGAFDRCFNIVREEGAAYGGVVVQDSLELVNNLIRSNLANQRLFREMGHIGQLPKLLASYVVPPPLPAGGPASGSSAASREPLPAQQTAILLCAMETLLLLVAAPTSAGEDARAAELANRVANQSKLLAAGALEALLPLALQDGGVASIAVRTQAVRCVGELVAGSSSGQDKLAAAQVSILGQLAPVLQAALRMALYASEARERSAAEHLIRCFCGGNPEGQGTLLSTIAPIGAMSEGMSEQQPSASTFGTELVAALLGGSSGSSSSNSSSSLLASGRAAGVLQYLLEDNLPGKQRLLSIPLVAGGGSTAMPAEYLLPRCMRHLLDAVQAGDASGRTAAVLLLRCLVVWLYGCSPAVSVLLEGASHLPMLVDLVNGRMGAGDPSIAGMASVLLCVCMLYSSDEPSSAPSASSTSGGGGTGGGMEHASHHRRSNSWQPATARPSHADMVLDVVLQRVGISTLFARLDDLKRSGSFLAASRAPRLPKPVTRNAALAASHHDRNDYSLSDESSRVSVSGTTTHVDGGTGGGDGGGTDGGSSFDQQLVALVLQIEGAAKQRTMDAFTQAPRPASSQGGSDPLAALDLQPSSSDSPEVVQRLHTAQEAVARMAQELHDARTRNRALAEDLFRVTAEGRSASTLPTAGGVGLPGVGGRTAVAGHGAAHAGTSSSSSGTGATSAAELEARVAAELRASRAEAELATHRQQVVALQARLSSYEQQLVELRDSALSGTAAAAKAESDLRDLSAAYNTLEEHSFRQEATLRDAQAKLAAAQHAAPAGGAGGVPEAQVQRRVDAAVAAALDRAERDRRDHPVLRDAKEAGAGGAAGGDDVAAQIEAAVAEARAAAEADGEEQLTDLLICLGQEEQKVALLRGKLEELGVDPEPLLASVGQEEEDDEGGEGQQ